MQVNPLKRHSMRALLTVHIAAMAVAIGGRVAVSAVEHGTEADGLHSLALGRDLAGTIGRGFVLPAFFVMIVSGIAMTVLRYGKRPPAWVWIKSAVTAIAFLVASPLVAPALASARYWAHWSADHGQLAPQFQESAARASFFGAIAFLLFLVNIPVAVWKPVFAFRWQRLFSRPVAEPPFQSKWLPRDPTQLSHAPPVDAVVDGVEAVAAAEKTR